MANYLERLASIESSSNPRAQSKTSSATGLYQMTKGTFAGLKKNNPELAGISWEQHSADPAIQKQFANLLTQENEKGLKKSGFEATDLNRYLAHFAGQSGASKLLKADPTMLAKDILGPIASKANASLIGAKTTVSDLMDVFARKLGNVAKPKMAAAPEVIAPMAAQSRFAPTSQSSTQDLQEAMASLDKGKSVLNTRVLTPTTNAILAGQPIAAKSGGMIKPVEKYQVKKYASGGKMPWEKSASEFGEPAAVNTVASAAEAPAAEKMPWEKSASDFGESTTKVADVKAKAKVQAQADSGVNKVSDWLGKTFSGAAKSLNVRPQQVEGNVLSGIKIREKTPEEAARAPTRAADRAKFWSGLGQGALADAPLAIGQMLAPEGGTADKAINSYMGGYDKFGKELTGEGFDASRLLGNVVSPIAIKGASLINKGLPKIDRVIGSPGLVTRGIIQGTAGGAIQPVLQDPERVRENEQNPELGTGFWGDKATQIGVGAVSGGVLNKLLGKSGAQYKPQLDDKGNVVPLSMAELANLSPSEKIGAVSRHLPEWEPTWGQQMGPRMAGLEQLLNRVPGVGRVLREAEHNSLATQNLAMMNRALKDSGLKLDKDTKPGYGMFGDAYDMLTHKYSTLLSDTELPNPKLLREKIYGKVDSGDGKSLATGEQMADAYKPGVISEKYNSLSEAGQQQFDKIMNGFFKKFGKDPKGDHSIGMTGEQFKNHEEAFKEDIADFMAGNGETRKVGRMLKSALGEIYDSLDSKVPEVKDQLKKLNKSYAQYKTLEGAAASTSNKGSVFTPTSTIREGGKGNRSSKVRGKALLQPEAQLSQDILGEYVPSSGTSERLLHSNAGKSVAGYLASLPMEFLYGPAGRMMSGQGTKLARWSEGTRLGNQLTKTPLGITRGMVAPEAIPEESAPPTPTIAHGGRIPRYDALRYNVGGMMPMQPGMMGMQPPMMGMQQNAQVMPYMQPAMPQSTMSDPGGMTNQVLTMQAQFAPKPLQSSASAGNNAGYAGGGMVPGMFPMQQAQQIAQYPYGAFNPMMGMSNAYASGGPISTDLASLMRGSSINKGLSEDMPTEFQAITDTPSIASMKSISDMPAIKRKHSKIKLPSLIEAYKKVQAENAPAQSILDTSSLT